MLRSLAVPSRWVAKDGICTRLFYNTSIDAAIEQFTEDGIMVDDVSFTLISVKEDTI